MNPEEKDELLDEMLAHFAAETGLSAAEVAQTSVSVLASGAFSSKRTIKAKKLTEQEWQEAPGVTVDERMAERARADLIAMKRGLDSGITVGDCPMWSWTPERDGDDRPLCGNCGRTYADHTKVELARGPHGTQ